MKVSIIIPSYRQPHFLGRAIESCLEQDYDDLEVIVVDDRSRDASLGLALSYQRQDTRVRVVECVENGGLGKARNVGIARATGEYLCFLDSDDYLLERSISARVEALPGAIGEYGDNVAGVYGDWQHVAEAIDHPTVRAPRSNMAVVDASNYTGENVFICSAPLVRREAVLAAGGFPEGLPMLEDFALWSKMIAGGASFVPVGHVVATYRQRPNSMLRGDDGIVMADYVDVINSWATERDVSLADGGAMAAWLADETPYSYGRMSWNLPSILGSFGQGAAASAVHAGTVPQLETVAATVAIDDFMNASTVTGLANPSPFWTRTKIDSPAMSLIVRTLKHSLEAVTIIEEFSSDAVTVAVFAEDPLDWSVTWPLALAGHQVASVDDIAASSTRIDLGEVDHQFVSQSNLVSDAVRMLWPDPHDRSGSLVYVPERLGDYPALDAWISVALHALADAGLDPKIICDPAVRTHLGGHRSSFLSIEAVEGADLVVAPAGPHLQLLHPLTEVVVFDPSSRSDHHPRTKAELVSAIGRSIRARRVRDA